MPVYWCARHTVCLTKWNPFTCAVGCWQPRGGQARSGEKLITMAFTRFCLKITSVSLLCVSCFGFTSSCDSPPMALLVSQLSWTKTGLCSKSSWTVWADPDSGMAKSGCVKHISIFLDTVSLYFHCICRWVSIWWGEKSSRSLRLSYSIFIISSAECCHPCL